MYRSKVCNVCFRGANPYGNEYCGECPQNPNKIVEKPDAAVRIFIILIVVLGILMIFS